jgi:hypothetical protein
LAQAATEKMMQRAIIYAVFPSGRNSSDEAAFLRAAVQKAEASQSVKLLREFVWEVDFQAAPDAFGLLVAGLEQRQLAYGILPLGAEPQWIHRDPNKK